MCITERVLYIVCAVCLLYHDTRSFFNCVTSLVAPMQACQEQRATLLQQLEVIEENFKASVASIVKVASAQDLQNELQHQQKLKDMQVGCKADITQHGLASGCAVAGVHLCGCASC